ncbi:13E12 repeat family protein [Mycobacterium deserti]|uniref:13E12 repeat family protein n=1 Tax=Mycobacterium deserti TaxID=2978347 RepID=A0ABT2M9E8_9MYCO|nr:13E12 repeat family protein [Mycobacterium deserti]MCT7658874.1 13E12 repeat family protein [Mycobacterium deserti]
MDYQTRDCCEETLAALAAEHTPRAVQKAADRLAALINPDGQYTDLDRKRRRYAPRPAGQCQRTLAWSSTSQQS